MKFSPRHFSKSVFASHKARAEKDWQQFWKDESQLLLKWDEPFTKGFEGDFARGEFQWFRDGKINASVNCLDRHVAQGRGSKVAYYYQSEDGKVKTSITYQQLLQKVCVYSNVLQYYGAQKGDRVIIYMPMGIEVVASILACARMGLVHSVVFAGFSAQALRARIEDCQSQFIITANSFHRGGKTIPLYSLVQNALTLLEGVSPVKQIFVYPHCSEDPCQLVNGDLNLLQLEQEWAHQDWFSPVSMNAEDPLFILYTSGSTGKPKGLLHTTGGYLTMAAYTHRYVFDFDPEDTYWCTADVGWITGHSYVVYGPLLNQATSLLYEGAPSHPHWGRLWSLVDEYKIKIFYTAPTAIRSFMAQGEEVVRPYELNSLRLLGTVGEPINPAAWEWYFKVIGKEKCPIVDTWWQTETGAIMITPLAGVHETIPGFAMESLPGIFPEIIDGETHQPSSKVSSGPLVIGRPWPSMARTIYGDHQRYLETYFLPYPGYYFTGDGCERNEQGYLRITGRIDDVINVAGHRLGTAEVESALVKHPWVAEAAVVGVEDSIKGQGLACFVRINQEHKSHAKNESALLGELMEVVMEEIGRFARPKEIFIVDDLPKTRSGKIMRRILRKLAAGEKDELGDLSTLSAPEMISQLLEVVGRQRGKEDLGKTS